MVSALPSAPDPKCSAKNSSILRHASPCRDRLWSGVGQFHYWAECQRAVRFVVQEGVTGGWIDLDIVRYAVSA